MKFKIVSSNLPNYIEIESEAITWGEFKKDLAKHDINTSNICGIVRSTHNTLNVDSAILPHNTDVEVIFLVPNKMESGVKEHIPEARVEEMRKIIEDIIENIPKISNDLSRLSLKLHFISKDVKGLDKYFDTTEKLKDELNDLTRQLSEV